MAGSAFDLSASEMRTLVDQAPDALKRVLDDDGGSGIERVYVRVSVGRTGAALVQARGADVGHLAQAAIPSFS